MLIPGELIPLGTHGLRGVPDPMVVFALRGLDPLALAPPEMA